ncbi:MAG: chorismate synthase [Methanobacterium sp.]|nr:chorismate synthase [Methanobacterium sp.]
MSGNKIGKMFNVTNFGSSHGKALGAVVDGCPANLEISDNDIQIELDKRRPGTSNITSSRQEKDKINILSGLFNGKTDGTPITAVVYNRDMDSSAYENLKNNPRPGHGDYTWKTKYDIYDYRGGGRGSGRTTIGHVIGGAIAKKLLNTMNIKVLSHVTQIGNIKAAKMEINEIEENIDLNTVRCADPCAAQRMEALILHLKESRESVGGIVETIISNVPAGLGEPVFNKLDSDIAHILMGIGSVKGVEIGIGFKAAELKGSQMNDGFYIDNNIIKTRTNNAGGILGGISTGMPIIIRMAVKPTPSISQIQKTVDLKTMKDTKIKIEGRHDPCICPRITTVAKASVSIIIADHLIRAGYIHPCKLK